MFIDPLPLDGERADTRRKLAILFEMLAIAIVGIILAIQTRKHRSSFVVLQNNSYPIGITDGGLIHDLLPLSIHILTDACWGTCNMFARRRQHGSFLLVSTYNCLMKLRI